MMAGIISLKMVAGDAQSMQECIFFQEIWRKNNNNMVALSDFCTVQEIVIID